MKKIVLIFTVINLSHRAFSQVLASVDKIVFKYEKGHSSWGKQGVYSSAEVVEFEKGNDKTSFQLSRFIRVSKSLPNNQVVHQVDTSLVSYYKKKISDVLVYDLIDNLSQSKDNFNTLFIVPYLSKPEVKDIKKIAVRNGYTNRLFGENSIKRKREDIIANIKSLSFVDSFIVEKKEWTKHLFMSNDDWDYFSIDIIKSDNDTLSYWSRLSQPLAQPLVYLIKGSNKKEQKIYNLQINLILQKVLPLASQLRQRITIDSLLQDYILWYLKHSF